MAEHLKQQQADAPPPNAFTAMGKPIHLQARRLGYQACRKIGLDMSAAWQATNGMADKLERNEPLQAQEVAGRHLALPGVYRLMSVLLVEALVPPPAEDLALRADLDHMRTLYDEYLARVKAHGTRTLLYTQPCCGRESEAPAGPKTGQWDTLASCVHCGALYMKISKADRIEALVLEQDEQPTGSPA